jgi:hypothetical protein
MFFVSSAAPAVVAVVTVSSACSGLIRLAVEVDSAVPLAEATIVFVIVESADVVATAFEANAMFLMSEDAPAVTPLVTTAPAIISVLAKSAIGVADTTAADATVNTTVGAPDTVVAPVTEPEMFLATPSAVVVVISVLTAADWFDVLARAAEVAVAVLIAAARLAVLLTAPSVAAVVVACPAIGAVLASVEDAVAAACADAARLNPSETLAATVAVHEREPASAKPNVICANDPTVPLPATAMFLVSEADAEGLAAPVITPVRLGALDSGAAMLAAQLMDAASDWRIPALPFRVATFRAEPFSSIRYPTIKRR